MVDIADTRPKVFISSVFRERIDGAWTYVPLRRRIIDARASLPVNLWAYDIFWPEGSETPEPAADTIIDRCFAGVRNCDLFVFLLTGRHGTGAGYTPDRVEASYLELELFAAAMLQKPILVLEAAGRLREPSLSDALELLQRTFPPDRYVVENDGQLYDRFQAECEKLASPQPGPAPSIVGRFADWLSRRRSRAAYRAELADPGLRFLDGNVQSRGHANPDRAAVLLDQVASGKRGDDESTGLMPHGASLFRVWAAMRELMDEKQSALNDPALAPLWDRACGLWASHASWFGLHGHLWMGPLASVQTQIALRRKFAAEPAFRAAIDVREPVGARASALYSVAQRMGTWPGSVRHFRMSAELATQAIDQNPDTASGALSIRGRASMQLARVGFVWKLWEAEADFRRGLALRERAGSLSAGEGMTDLGLCLVFQGRSKSGLRMLQEGVNHMRADEGPNGKAFLARALRSLERGAKFAGRRDVAVAAREERLTLAREIEAIDQTREA